jgi:hypothetical protein
MANLLSGASAGAAQSTSPPPVPPPCSSPEYRALDFWVGDWVLDWVNPDGTKGTGTNRITRDEYGSCVIFEHFAADDKSLRGMSVSTYFPPQGKWRQAWVDDQGGLFDLAGGPVAGQGHTFELENLRLIEKAPFRRMIWQDVTAHSLTWRWQGKASADAEWQDSWVIHYRRK